MFKILKYRSLKVYLTIINFRIIKNVLKFIFKNTIGYLLNPFLNSSVISNFKKFHELNLYKRIVRNSEKDYNILIEENAKGIKKLFDYGANFRVRGGCKTSLHLAVSYGHPKLVELLLEDNANVHEVDSDGCLPLHYAMEANNKACVDLLLAAGSTKDVVLKNNDGLTPLDLASTELRVYIEGKQLLQSFEEYYASVTDDSKAIENKLTALELGALDTALNHRYGIETSYTRTEWTHEVVKNKKETEPPKVKIS